MHYCFLTVIPRDKIPSDSTKETYNGTEDVMKYLEKVLIPFAIEFDHYYGEHPDVMSGKIEENSMKLYDWFTIGGRYCFPDGSIIKPLNEMEDDIESYGVMFVDRRYDQVEFIIMREVWTGVNYLEVSWDCNFWTAYDKYLKKIKLL